MYRYTRKSSDFSPEISSPALSGDTANVSKRVITVLPVRIFDFIFGKVVGLYHALDNFTGRK